MELLAWCLVMTSHLVTTVVGRTEKYYNLFLAVEEILLYQEIMC